MTPTAKLKHASHLLARRSPLAPWLRSRSGRFAWSKPIALARKSGPAHAARWLVSDEGRQWLQESRVLDALLRDTLLDVEVELLLTEARRMLLLEGIDPVADAGLHPLVEALIVQGDINEHVFLVTAEEREALAHLVLDAAAVAGGSRAAARALVVHAMYASPRELMRVAGVRASFEGWLPRPFAALMEEARVALAEEAQVAPTIARVGEIRDAVSQAVASQYEENPYPRWLSLEVTPGFRARQLDAYFEPQALRFLDQPFRVLIAGCATGRQAIRCALGYGERASVLAIDLSRASLAYAARMARRMGVTNIEFAQADLMDVVKLGRRFDIVESTGVLHHLDDPMKGWRAVVDVLAPGGLMYIGLYSEPARRTVSDCREEIARRGLGSTADAIRGYRRELIAREGADRIWRRWQYFPFCRDFFSLSNCRDLLFHVNERQFTIPRIESCLDELGLDFHGFVLPPPPGDCLWPSFPAADDLRGWRAFEQRYPETFAQMYEFWCRKH